MNRRGWMASLAALVAGLPFVYAADGEASGDVNLQWPNAISYLSIDGSKPERIVSDPYCQAGWIYALNGTAIAGPQIIGLIARQFQSDTTVTLTGGRVIPAWSLRK